MFHGKLFYIGIWFLCCYVPISIQWWVKDFFVDFLAQFWCIYIFFNFKTELSYKCENSFTYVATLSKMVDVQKKKKTVWWAIILIQTGADGCIFYFEYARDGNILEFIGMKQVQELSLVQSTLIWLELIIWVIIKNTIWKRLV